MATIPNTLGVQVPSRSHSLSTIYYTRIREGRLHHSCHCQSIANQRGDPTPVCRIPPPALLNPVGSQPVAVGDSLFIILLVIVLSGL